MSSDLVRSDATRLAAMIRAREVSPVEVVRAHLDRIEAVDSRINAIVTVAADALESARAAEAAVLAGEELGPLHGVPFTAKDSIDTAGVMTQRGSPIFRGRIPGADATSVARLKAAGAILLAKTNLPEFSYSTETDNLLTGRANNPWNLDRTPGGSSGGESAAIAAGMSPLGLGTDLAISDPRPGGKYRDRRPEGNARARPHDRDLAEGPAAILARRPDGSQRPRRRPGLLAPRRAGRRRRLLHDQPPVRRRGGQHAGSTAPGGLAGRARLRADRLGSRGDRAGGRRGASRAPAASWSSCASRRSSGTTPSTSSGGSTSWRSSPPSRR